MNNPYLLVELGFDSIIHHGGENITLELQEELFLSISAEKIESNYELPDFTHSKFSWSLIENGSSEHYGKFKAEVFEDYKSKVVELILKFSKN